MNILQINSSARAENSQSTRLAHSIVERLREANPGATLTIRDLGRTPHPALDESALGALFTPADKRSPEQAARVALDDALIAELQAADVIVLGVPMYNFGVPTQLKNWIDAVARAGVTFKYTDKGPVGLLTGKKAYVFATRGGLYAGTPLDTQTVYVRDMLRFLGIDDVEFVYAEGLAIGAEQKAAALSKAQRAIERLVEPEAIAA